MTKKRLYSAILIVCSVGYIWLVYSILSKGTGSYDFCLFKKITSLPCPSCGSTRSILSILKGDLWQALLYNPLGYIIASAMLIFPLWILYDLISDKDSFLRAYNKFESIIKLRVVVIAIILVFANWAWNFHKFFN